MPNEWSKLVAAQLFLHLSNNDDFETSTSSGQYQLTAADHRIWLMIALVSNQSNWFPSTLMVPFREDKGHLKLASISNKCFY